MNSSNALDLVFDFEAIEWLAEQGIDLLKGGLSEEDTRNRKTYLLLVCAGSLHKDPEMSVEKARGLIKGLPFRVVIDGVTSAIKESLGAKPESTAEASSA